VLHLRPHHLIDIIRNIGHDRPIVPHHYGHEQHIVTKAILDNSENEIMLTAGADDLCKSCIHLTPEGLCDDVLPQLKYKVEKQQYNDALDRRVMDYLGLEEGTTVQIDDFLCLVEQKFTGLVSLCIHPKENKEYRSVGLKEGIRKLRGSNSH